MSHTPFTLAVLISGSGTNLQAILDATDSRELPARVGSVISNNPDAGGLVRAKQHGVTTTVVNHREYPDRGGFDRALEQALTALSPDLVVLAGFMRVLGPELVERWHGRMLNIHPSLLPDYRGLHTHRRVLEAGERWHGTSVHYVTPELDGGPVIARCRIPVAADETEHSLQQKVQAQEHKLYPEVIGWIAAGRLELRDGRPVLDGTPLSEPVERQYGGGPR